MSDFIDMTSGAVFSEKKKNTYEDWQRSIAGQFIEPPHTGTLRFNSDLGQQLHVGSSFQHSHWLKRCGLAGERFREKRGEDWFHLNIELFWVAIDEKKTFEKEFPGRKRDDLISTMGVVLAALYSGVGQIMITYGDVESLVTAVLLNVDPDGSHERMSPKIRELLIHEAGRVMDKHKQKAREILTPCPDKLEQYGLDNSVEVRYVNDLAEITVRDKSVNLVYAYKGSGKTSYIGENFVKAYPDAIAICHRQILVATLAVQLKRIHYRDEGKAGVKTLKEAVDAAGELVNKGELPEGLAVCLPSLVLKQFEDVVAKTSAVFVDEVHNLLDVLAHGDVDGGVTKNPAKVYKTLVELMFRKESTVVAADAGISWHDLHWVAKLGSVYKKPVVLWMLRNPKGRKKRVARVFYSQNELKSDYLNYCATRSQENSPLTILQINSQKSAASKNNILIDRFWCPNSLEVSGDTKGEPGVDELMEGPTKYVVAHRPYHLSLSPVGAEGLSFHEYMDPVVFCFYARNSLPASVILQLIGRNRLLEELRICIANPQNNDQRGEIEIGGARMLAQARALDAAFMVAMDRKVNSYDAFKNHRMPIIDWATQHGKRLVILALEAEGYEIIYEAEDEVSDNFVKDLKDIANDFRDKLHKAIHDAKELREKDYEFLKSEPSFMTRETVPILLRYRMSRTLAGAWSNRVHRIEGGPEDFEEYDALDKVARENDAEGVCLDGRITGEMIAITSAKFSESKLRHYELLLHRHLEKEAMWKDIPASSRGFMELNKRILEMSYAAIGIDPLHWDGAIDYARMQALVKYLISNSVEMRGSRFPLKKLIPKYMTDGITGKVMLNIPLMNERWLKEDNCIKLVKDFFGMHGIKLKKEREILAWNRDEDHHQEMLEIILRRGKVKTESNLFDRFASGNTSIKDPSKIVGKSVRELVTVMHKNSVLPLIPSCVAPALQGCGITKANRTVKLFCKSVREAGNLKKIRDAGVKVWAVRMLGVTTGDLKYEANYDLLVTAEPNLKEEAVCRGVIGIFGGGEIETIAMS